MKRWLAVAAFAAGALFVGTLPAAQESGVAIPDRDLGLSKGAVSDVVDPPAELTNLSEPGDRPTTPRDFPQQPPRAPHGVEALLPITMDENQCMDCHAVEEKVEGEPTPIPVSHYTDLRNSPDTVGKGLVGARYVCVSCHVSQAANELLVENRYRLGD